MLVLIEGMFGLVQETERKWDMSCKPCYSIVWRWTFWVPEEIDLASKLKMERPIEWGRQQQVAPEIKNPGNHNQIAITIVPLNWFLFLFLVSENCWRHWYAGDFLCSCSGLLIGQQCFSPGGWDQAVNLGPSSCKVDVTAPVLLKVCGLTGFGFGLQDWRLSLNSKSGVSKGTFPGPTVRGKPELLKTKLALFFNLGWQRDIITTMMIWTLDLTCLGEGRLSQNLFLLLGWVAE